jgi:uncharacterized membrane protein YphA (DoxX/SURF4 family)
MTRKVVIEIISFLFILLFVYAAVAKLLDFEKFKIQVGQSPLLTGFGDYIPWIVISAEIIVTIALMIPRIRLVGFFAAFSLMTMFTAYIFAILHFSPYVPCSCGGVLEKFGWQEHLVFNIVFLALGLTGIILHVRPNTKNASASTLLT